MFESVSSDPPPEVNAAESWEFSFLDLIEVLTRRFRLVAAATLFLATAAVVLFLAAGREYVAESRVVPESADAGGASNLAGIAASFGLAMPEVLGGNNNSAFVAALLGGRQLLEAAVLSEYSFLDGDGNRVQGNLIQLYGIEAETRERALQQAVRRLEDDTEVRVDAATGIIVLNTRSLWRDLAEGINARLLELVAAKTAGLRRAGATEERRFVEGRVREAHAALGTAEEDLRRFMEANRDWGGSAQLRLEQERLQRVVDLRQQLFVSLSQTLEQVRIEEVRTTPVLSILDPADGSARPSVRLVFVAVLAGLAGLAIGVFLALLVEAFARLRKTRPEWFDRVGSNLRAALPRFPR